MNKTVSIVLAVMIMLAACGIASAEQGTRKIETAEDANEFMAAFLGEHPEEMEGIWAFSPQMEAALIQTGGVAGLAKQLAVGLSNMLDSE